MTDNLIVALMDHGFVTHGVHANTRMVYLEYTLQDNTLIITGPANGDIYQPGPGYLYIVVDDVPSQGYKVMVGDGKAPAVDLEAAQKCVYTLGFTSFECTDILPSVLRSTSRVR